MLPNVYSVSKCLFQQEFYTAPLGIQLKTGLCNLCFQKFVMLPSNQTFLYTNLPADDWHNVAWNQPGLQVRYICPKFWADCPQVKHLPSKHTSILKASCLQPLPSTGCSEGFCWHGHLMHKLIQCTYSVYSVSFRNCSGGGWIVVRQRDISCFVYIMLLGYFSKGGGRGMTPPSESLV